MSIHPALFLDRDGVIIENCANYVRSWADVEIFPQALQALAGIHNTPYKIIVVTNQSVVGRGLISLTQATAINERLLVDIEKANGRVDAFYMCPHAPVDDCECRKPRPGLLQQAAQDHHINLANSIMIGDALTDLQAGWAAGVKQVALLRTGRGQAQAQLPTVTQLPPFPIYNTLAEALVELL